MKILSIANLLATYVYLISIFSVKPHSNIQSLPLSTPKYKKLIFILLDGLRIDGAVRTANNNFYFNKLPSLYSMKAYKALSLCENPTLTSIRIKSMVNGTPSNFLEGLGAFFHTKSKVPNFFDSIKNKSLLFFGDETWTDLFGVKGKTYNAYGKEFPMDLEIEYMEDFTKSVSKAEVLIGHFSALDSYGHVLTINHPKMSRILNQFDDLIKNVHERMDDDTLLVITSDHGVTDKGDHGGASTKERSSFVYFADKKGSLKTPCNESKHPEFNWVNSLEDFGVVNQEDIFPTICALFGVSIPFNSFGNLIPDLISEPEVYAAYAIQKMKMLKICSREQKAVVKTLLHKYSDELRLNKTVSKALHLKICKELNKNLSEKIHQEFCAINTSLVYLSISITLVSCLMLSSSVKIDLSVLLLILAIVMVSHSVYSFIHEDLIWTFVFLFNNCSLNNLLICAIIHFIGKHPQHSQDRWVAGGKVDARYDSRPWFILVVLLSIFVRKFVLCNKNHKNNEKEVDWRRRASLGLSSGFANRVIKTVLVFSKKALKQGSSLFLSLVYSMKRTGETKSSTKLETLKRTFAGNFLFSATYTCLGHLCSMISEFMSNPLITFLLFKYFVPNYVKGPVNLDFLLHHPSLETFSVLIYDPPSSFFIIYLLPLLTPNSLSSSYALAHVAFFTAGLNYDLSSISTEIPHVFSREFSLAAMIPLICYYLFYIKIRTLKTTRKYLAVATFHAFVVQVTTYVVYNEMIYFFFFVGRCFFVMGYFLLENLLYLIK